MKAYLIDVWDIPERAVQLIEASPLTELAGLLLIVIRLSRKGPKVLSPSAFTLSAIYGLHLGHPLVLASADPVLMTLSAFKETCSK